MTDNNTKITPAARRLIFNDRVYGTILEEVMRQTIGCLKTGDVKTKFKMYSRKIQLHRYGRDVMLYIAREGHVTIELKEFTHDNYVMQLFEYSEDEQQQEAFLSSMEKLTCSIHQLTTENRIIVLDSFEQTKEELNLQFSELMELLGNNVNTHVEFKVNELIRLSMGLGFAQGMRFEHYVERFMDPLQE